MANNLRGNSNYGARVAINTAKLPIETVKRLIGAVATRPHLWGVHNGQKRSDINLLWQEVGQQVHLPADVCRTKWGHLRDNFRKVFIRNTMSDETPTTWRFYNDMRFMEQPVAEAIMRQNRFKKPTSHWRDLTDQTTQAAAKISNQSRFAAALLPPENLGHDPHTFSFSEISAFVNCAQANKRAKLASPDFHLAAAQKHYQNSPTDFETNADADDDDEFDEDAATENNDQDQDSPDKQDVFTIEVFDDEEKPCRAAEAKLNDFTTDAASKPDCSGVFQETDSDRMFLLSLLPYLQKVDERKKLRVRQKLQSVLIDELL